MDIGVRATLLPSDGMHDDPDASPGFCRDALGFEVRHDAGPGGMRWTTAGPAGRDGTPVCGLPVHREVRQSHRVDVTHDSRSDHD
jgi:hypothetical protein